MWFWLIGAVVAEVTLGLWRRRLAFAFRFPLVPENSGDAA